MSTTLIAQAYALRAEARCDTPTATTRSTKFQSSSNKQEYTHNTLRNVTDSAGSATVPVAQNIPSEAADPQRSDLTGELPRDIQSRHPHTNQADIALHRPRLSGLIPA